MSYSEIQEIHNKSQNDYNAIVDYSQLEVLKIELENFLGDDVFADLYKVIDDYYVIL